MKQLNESKTEKHNQFILIIHRNRKDFKFGCWDYEHKENKDLIVYGRLKKSNSRCKYIELIHVKNIWKKPKNLLDK